MHLRAVFGELDLNRLVCWRIERPGRGGFGDATRVDGRFEPHEIDTEIRDGLITEIRILVERFGDDPFELRRQTAGVQAQGRRLPIKNGDERVAGRRTGERRTAGDQLVQHDAQAEAVRTPVDVQAACLLRRHVRDRPDHHPDAGVDGPRGARIGIRCTLGELGDAEVEHLHVAVRPQHQVVGLDVAMHDAGRVRRCQRRGGLDGDLENLAQRQLATLQALAQRFAFDQLRDDVARLVVIADFVNGQDVRVVQRRRRARLLQEAGDALGIGTQALEQELDRHRPAERRIVRLVDLAHAAAAEQGADLVTADGGAGGKRHRAATLAKFARSH